MIVVPIILWYKLISGLRRRGQGVRESGAFLLSPVGKQKITKVLFYDELDPAVSNSGIIKFSHRGHLNLFSILKELELDVKADIHTHPGANTNQSQSDQTHPMVRIPGHVAIIAPFFAQKFTLPHHCSHYIYQGDFKWKQPPRKAPILKLTLL